MEVKVYYRSDEGLARVVSHRIPDYNGMVRTESVGGNEGKAVDATVNDVDFVSDVIETFEVREDGAFLTRRVLYDRYADESIGPARLPNRGYQSVCIVSGKHLDGVDRIEVDGTVVWPEEEAEDERTREMFRRMADAVSEEL